MKVNPAKIIIPPFAKRGKLDGLETRKPATPNNATVRFNQGTIFLEMVIDSKLTSESKSEQMANKCKGALMTTRRTIRKNLVKISMLTLAV